MKNPINARRAGKGNQDALIMKKYHLVISVIILITLSSCSHYYYVANTKNVPLLREKNEGRVSLTYGEGDESSSVDFQGSYAINDKIGVMANFMSANGGSDSGQDPNWAKGTYVDAAVGYYKPLGSVGVFEIYGGYGASSQHHQYYSNGTADLRFRKVFVQPSIGLTGNWYEMAFSLPLSRVSFNEINDYTTGGEQQGLDKLTYAGPSCILEPAFTIRGGWKYVKLQFQYVHVLSLTNQDLPFERDKVSLGVYFSIVRRYGKEFQPK
jgi:hypothetical protein